MDAGDVPDGGRVRQHFGEYGGDWFWEVAASVFVAGPSWGEADVCGGEVHREGREADVRGPRFWVTGAVCLAPSRVVVEGGYGR